MDRPDHVPAPRATGLGLLADAGDLVARPLPAAAFALVGGGVLVLAVLFCIVHSWLTAQSASLMTSAVWAASMLVPWLGVLELAKRRLLRTGRLDFILLTVTLAAALAVSVGIQAAYLAALSEDVAIFAIFWRRLPAAVLVALPLIAAHFLLRRRVANVAADDTGADAELLRRADWIKGAGNYVEARLGDRTRLCRLSMERCERLLGDAFVRIHRSTIVNGAAIVGVEKDATGAFVRLRDGTRHRVGDRYRHRIVD